MRVRLLVLRRFLLLQQVQSEIGQAVLVEQSQHVLYLSALRQILALQ